MFLLMDNQQLSSVIDRESSETIPEGSRVASDWRLEVVGAPRGEDIVHSLSKDKGAKARLGVASLESCNRSNKKER